MYAASLAIPQPMQPEEWDYVIQQAKSVSDESAERIKNLRATFVGWPCHLSAFYGEEAITVEHAKYGQSH